MQTTEIAKSLVKFGLMYKGRDNNNFLRPFMTVFRILCPFYDANIYSIRTLLIFEHFNCSGSAVPLTGPIVLICEFLDVSGTYAKTETRF